MVLINIYFTHDDRYIHGVPGDCRAALGRRIRSGWHVDLARYAVPVLDELLAPASAATASAMAPAVRPLQLPLAKSRSPLAEIPSHPHGPGRPPPHRHPPP